MITVNRKVSEPMVPNDKVEFITTKILPSPSRLGQPLRTLYLTYYIFRLS